MSFNKAVAVLTGLVLAAILFAAPTRGRQANPQAESTARVERGRYLVASVGCADCHAPKVMGSEGPEPDMTRFLSGHPENAALPAPPQLPAGPWIAVASADLTAWSGPWGISYAFNLTPDENTGIGSWSEDTFVKAIKTGRHMGVSRPILPPMPWTAFRNFTDEDLRSIFAYLRTIPPVHNRVPEPVAPRAVTTEASK
jgi:mono/diheme cytochrome c family protein